ncbi:PREDICTED: uncharacterized protein LOC104772711 [Camelina sativa]|uniref:Uncharacterized protein LOC104772711 n=1 Tax=Camelina sativa TaxID=90675 RepID=A0ABM0Y501_CAMSA|nr:PREDICTED: uncharacterized protein LOC104772711 [Camelina sativa]
MSSLLFLEYERDEISDLHIDDNDKGIYKGKVFTNKEDCQIGLAIYAVKNMFHFKQTHKKRDYFVLNWSGERCEWRIMAKELRNGYYEICKACLEHTCPVETRRNYMKKTTSRAFAAVFKAKLSDPSKAPLPMDLQQLVLEDLKVSASYSKCWRAREKAIEDLFGCDEESYYNLAEYLHLLKLANPGTVTNIKIEIEEDGSERLLYTFLAFGASIQGFSKLRRVLLVDGAHLTGKYKGVLLTASGQDGNFQVFPLAFAVVDSEDDDAWTWFFEKVERIIADSKTLTIISNRHQSIYVAKKRGFLLAHHGACIVHLARNVNAKFHNKGLAKLVTNAAYAFTIGSFGQCMYILEGDRYNLMTSNIAETLNKALWKVRASPIVELLKFIRDMLTRWFNAWRKKSAKHKELVTPKVDRQMTKKHHVLLDLKKCTCKQYDQVKVPCGHAMLAANYQGIPLATLVDEYYKTSTWAATYARVINPEVNPNDLGMADEIVRRDIITPKASRPFGRPPRVEIHMLVNIR